MIKPMEFTEGIGHFKEIYSPEEVGLIIIPTTKNSGYEREMVNLLSMSEFPIPEKRTFEYTPPRSVGHNLSPRDEKIPHLDPSLAYIIGDDSIEEGNTLDIAVKRAVEQNISLEKIWSFIAITLNKKWISINCYFDKPKIFLDYLKSLS